LSETTHKFYNSIVIVAVRRYLPGLIFAFGVTFIGFSIHWRFSAVSPLVASLVIGVILGNLSVIPRSCEPGQKFAAKRVLRIGIVLLGTQLAAEQIVELGGREVIVVLLVVATTFLGTMWLGPRLGVSKSLSLLIATGFSICGASAVAAVDGVVDADEEEVAYAIALVTLCGSLAIAVLPLLRDVVGLGDPHFFGAWVGASVHDVAQVIATASTGGNDAVHSATVVKLSRVLLLAPLIGVISVWIQRPSAGITPRFPGRKAPLIPAFVVGFIAMVVLRTTGVIPDDWLSPLKKIEQWALAAALVGLGSEVKVRDLMKVGGRPLVLALTSWAGIATVSLLGVKYIA
jgi:uncharacterized integral membrane protein (TIGR00698 family)